MTKKEHIDYWRESAQHDLESAEGIFDSAIFSMCEKGFPVKNRQSGRPPIRTDTLVKALQAALSKSGAVRIFIVCFLASRIRLCMSRLFRCTVSNVSKNNKESNNTG